ncbi:MAG: hypothetical protein LBT53_07215 [Puniceicoccales bacterium]|jgi:tRNA threonylcarbamoyladenosine biosynthesis protein TsaB|nr:hypothetical protein [Puniceicoccales bacterium]
MNENFPVAGAPFLFLDAAGRLPVTGVWRDGTWLAFHRAENPAASETLFALIDATLADAKLRPTKLGKDSERSELGGLGGFIFAEGPGSVLGIRIAAIALRSWLALPEFAGKPVFAFGSLTLAAHLLLRNSPDRRDFSLLADSRLGRWNTLAVRNSVVPETFSEMSATELAVLPQPRFRITQRALGEPPSPWEPFPENLLERDPATLAVPNLMHTTNAPDAANTPAQYAKWAPLRHRAEERG